MTEKEIIEELREKYRTVRNGHLNPDAISGASQWLDEFYQNPESIVHHINYYQSEQNKTERQAAIIGIKASIKNTWEEVSEDDKAQILESILNCLTIEPSWLNRRTLIDVVRLCNADNFNEIIFSFITSSFDKQTDAHLEIALLLSLAITEAFVTPNNADDLVEFYHSMLDNGFSSPQPEVRLAALDLLIHAKFVDAKSFSEQNPQYWESAVEILDPYVQNSTNLPRLVRLYTDAISDKLLVVNPIPLLEHCIELFENGSDFAILMQLQTIISNICHSYPEAIFETELYKNIFSLFIALSKELFDPEDDLSLTSSTFFTSAFTDITNDETAAELWEMCSSEIEDPAGLFVFISTLSATFTVATDFYIDHFEDVIQLLHSGIESEFPLVRDGSAAAIDVFVQCFVFESDELSLSFVPSMIEVCRANVSKELLLVLSHLLDATRKTDEIFEGVLEFLGQIVGEGSSELTAAALPSITALAQWSTLKIFDHFGPILDLLRSILGEDGDVVEELKPAAIDCIAAVAKSVENEFDPFVEEFSGLFFGGLEDPNLAASCVSALDAILSARIDILQSVLPDLLPYLKERASEDLSSKYRRDLEIGDADPAAPVPSGFVITAHCLQLLSDLLGVSNEFFEENYVFVLQCAEQQSQSAASCCRVAASKALGNVSQFYPEAMGSEAMDEMALFIGRVLTSLTDPSNDVDVRFKAFQEACIIISNIEYYKLGEYWHTLLEQTMAALNDPKTRAKRPMVRGEDLTTAIADFLRAFCGSASEYAPEYLSEFIPYFVELTESAQQLRYKSLAMNFFAELIHYAGKKVDNELKMSVFVKALEMASENDDGPAFACIHYIALSIKDGVRPYTEQAMELFLGKLSMEPKATRNFTSMRDHCVCALGTWMMDILRDDEVDLSVVIPPALAAMPLQLEFQEAVNAVKFFKWLFNHAEGEYGEMFLRVILVEFSNHPTIVAAHGIPRADQIYFRNLAVQLLGNLQNAETFISEVCGGDGTRLNNLRNFLENTTEEEDAAVEEEENGEEEELPPPPPRVRRPSMPSFFSEEEDIESLLQQYGITGDP